MNCSSLEKLDLSNFNTINVTTMNYMFKGCSSLKELNISKFKTKKVKSAQGIFDECSSLKDLDKIKKYRVYYY